MKRKIFIILGILVSLIIAFSLPKCGGEAENGAESSRNAAVSYRIAE